MDGVLRFLDELPCTFIFSALCVLQKLHPFLLRPERSIYNIFRCNLNVDEFLLYCIIIFALCFA